MPRRRRKPSNSKTDGSSSNFNVESLKALLSLNEGTEITSISEEQCIAQLWAGYGSVNCFSVTLSNNDVMNLIVKRVDPPSVDFESTSHNRKIQSYHIEARFYEEIAPIVHQRNEPGVPCVIPNCHLIVHNSDESNDHSSSQSSNNSFCFLMNDLRNDFPDQHFRLDERRTRTALKWLASFHATFWEKDDVLQRNENNQFLWECGGYWHLRTRLEELEEVNGSWSFLKNCAAIIDERMHEGGTQFKTICHGDFKKQNLLFTDSGNECAAVDFQYCGGGYGMKDLVMLIVSSVSSEIIGRDTMAQQKGRERALLEFYRDELVKNLHESQRVPTSRIEAVTFDVLLSQYELALIDYVRFMAGWGFWGTNCDYAAERVKSLMINIAGCRNENDMFSKSMSPKEWRDAVYKYYPL